jgi:prepilin-type N-terminal cleavage/methylation domain-containing protein
MVHKYTQKTYQNAFTIVELLIVIVVIAILAAITIVAFNGIQRRAVIASVESDLRNSLGIVEATSQLNGQYPASINGSELAQSTSNTTQYVMKADGYCISVTGKNSVSRIATQNDKRIREGVCETVLQGTVSTFNTSGVAIQQVASIAKNPTGGFYILDKTAGKILKATEAGVLTAFADGFFRPSSIDIDSSGNLYVADTSNNRICKVSPDGTVSVLAGSGIDGYIDDIGYNARFNYPTSLTVSPDGVVYVADLLNHRIRKITPDGMVTTVAGAGEGMVDGAASVARFSQPRGITLGSDGILYIADGNNHRIRKITSDGTVSTLAGSSYGTADGIGSNAQFNTPAAIAFTDGKLYVADSQNNRIRMITLSGTVTTLTGANSGYVDGTKLNAQFSNPTALTASSSAELYVVDTGNNRIRIIK